MTGKKVERNDEILCFGCGCRVGTEFTYQALIPHKNGVRLCPWCYRALYKYGVLHIYISENRIVNYLPGGTLYTEHVPYNSQSRAKILDIKNVNHLTF